MRVDLDVPQGLAALAHPGASAVTGERGSRGGHACEQDAQSCFHSMNPTDRKSARARHLLV